MTIKYKIVEATIPIDYKTNETRYFVDILNKGAWVNLRNFKSQQEAQEFIQSIAIKKVS